MAERPASPPPLIKASELGEFDYCKRAWWLRHVRQMQPSPQKALAKGRAAHQRHFNAVEAARRWQRLGLFLVGAGLLLVVLLFLWGAG